MTKELNVAEPGLTAELTEAQLFAEIQSAIASGDESSLSQAMEKELVDVPAEVQPVVAVEPVTPEVVTASPEVIGTPAVVTPAVPEKDWFVDLPEEVQVKVKALKEEKDRLEHKIRSDEGRVPALQRQLEEMKRKVQAPRAEVPATKPTATSTSTLDAKIAAIREVDPMLADALVSIKEEVAAPIRQEVISRTEQIAEQVRLKEDQELWTRENEKLLAAVPQAHEVFKNPAYREWKAQQSEGLVALAESSYAEDVLVAFDKFARDMARRNPQIVAAPAATPVTPATPAPVVATPAAPASNVTNERARKLNASAPATVSGVAKGGDGLPTDPEALFKYFQEQIRTNKM